MYNSGTRLCFLFQYNTCLLAIWLWPRMPQSFHVLRRVMISCSAKFLRSAEFAFQEQKMAGRTRKPTMADIFVRPRCVFSAPRPFCLGNWRITCATDFQVRLAAISKKLVTIYAFLSWSEAIQPHTLHIEDISLHPVDFVKRAKMHIFNLAVGDGDPEHQFQPLNQ